MTQEDKELLLTDLCARVPYHPQCYCKLLEKAPNGTNVYVQELSTFVIDEIEIMDDPQFKCQICDVKPYLRSLSNMTEEEFTYIKQRWVFTEKCRDENDIMDVVNRGCVEICDAYSFVEWLNTHHFDYRGLIKKGLALEAPEGMYEIVPTNKVC